MIKHYKKQVDLYSFGIIFCEMMIKAPSSNYNNLIDRAEALATALINEEEKFEISCCRNFLSHCEEVSIRLHRYTRDILLLATSSFHPISSHLSNVITGDRIN